nr:hypothetical protein [Tanacetum cinerariifolium]
MPGPEHQPSPDYVLGPDEPKQAPLHHIMYMSLTLSLCYVADFDPEEEVEEQEASEVDDEEEVEHLASVDSSVIHVDDLVPSVEDTEAFKTAESAPTPVQLPRLRRARIFVRPQTPMSAAIEALIAMVVVALASSPPQSPLTLLSSLLPQIPSPSLLIPSPPLPLPSPPTYTSPTYDEKRIRFIALAFGFKVRESSAAATARQPGLDVATIDATPGCPMSREVAYGIEDVWDDMVVDMEDRAPTTIKGLNQRNDQALQRARVNTLFKDRRYHLHTIMLWRARLGTLGRHKDRPWTTTGRYMLSSKHIELSFKNMRLIFRHGILTLEVREPARTDDPKDAESVTKDNRHKNHPTPMIDAQIKALITQRVVDSLAEMETNKTSRNGDESHNSVTGSRRTERAARECTYNDFLKFQPLNLKGTGGVISLTQCFEMESVFRISNCTVTCQIKFATCTLLGSALTWCNSNFNIVGHDAAYGMPWKILKKMMTAKYYPRGEIKKLEIEL